MKKIFIFMMFALLSFSMNAQKATFNLKALGEFQDIEKMCYVKPGNDSLFTGWKLHRIDAITGYEFIVIDTLGNVEPIANERNCNYVPEDYEELIYYFCENGVTEAAFLEKINGQFVAIDNPPNPPFTWGFCEIDTTWIPVRSPHCINGENADLIEYYENNIVVGEVFYDADKNVIPPTSIVTIELGYCETVDTIDYTQLVSNICFLGERNLKVIEYFANGNKYKDEYYNEDGMLIPENLEPTDFHQGLCDKNFTRGYICDLTTNTEWIQVEVWDDNMENVISTYVIDRLGNSFVGTATWKLGECPCEPCDITGDDNEVFYINGTNTITLPAETYWSYHFTVIEGEVRLTENGVASPYALPVGFHEGDKARELSCEYLDNVVTITGLSGTTKAIISTLK